MKNGPATPVFLPQTAWTHALLLFNDFESMRLQKLMFKYVLFDDFDMMLLSSLAIYTGNKKIILKK